MPPKFGFVDSDERFWLSALGRYPAAVELVSEKKGLMVKTMIQNFHQQSNPAIVAEGGLDLEALKDLINVKLLHSKSRPGFMSRVTKNNTISQIKSITSEGFSMLEELNQNSENVEPKLIINACKKLSQIYGIGIATASLMLSKYYHQIPFMSDQALHEMVSLPTQTALKYNEKEYKTLYQKLFDKCADLNKDKATEALLLEPEIFQIEDNQDVAADSESNAVTKKWSLRTMQYAIWAYHITELDSLSKRRKWEAEDTKARKKTKTK